MAGEKVGEAYVELRAKMTKFKSELKSAETLTGKSVGRMQAKFQALAPTFRKVGIGMAVAGGAITAALGLAIKSSITFNKEMANIATLIPGATKRILELKGAIRTMAVTVGKDTADLAQGAYQVISAFGDTADTVAILEMSARAATAGVATTTDAINLLSAVTKGYGDTSKEAVQKASDLAFQTVTLGQTTFPELAASIGKAIPLAAELGVVEEELFTVMATGTGVTGKAAEVSTQLRGVFQSLLAPTADMTKLLESLGYESGKAMLAEEGLHGALRTIIKAAEDSGVPLQKYISSIEGQTLALALTGAQSDTYIEKLAAMRDSVGLTDLAFKEQTEGINKAGFAFQQAKIRIGVLAQEMGDRLLPMITPLIEKVTDLVKRMSEWSKAHPGISSAIVKFAAVLGPLLIALGGLLMVLPGLVAIAPAIGAAFHIMLGPVGLVTAAIAAAVAAFLYFYKTSDKFRNFINKIVAYIKAFVQNAWNRLVWLKDNWGKLWKTIFEGIPKIAKNAFDNLITIFKWVWEFIKGWGSWLGENFLNVWKNLFDAVSTGLKNFGENIVAQLSWLGKKMNPKNWFKKIERPDWTPLFDELETKWAEMPAFAELQLKKMADGVKIYFEPLPELVKPAFDAVKEGAEGAGKAIDDMTTATSSYITTFDKLLKLRGKDKELTEEEKKRIKELEEAQKVAQEEIKKIRATFFEEWKANNEARTKDLYEELAIQKQIEKDAKDEIVKIREMSFKDWKKQNEARTKQLYAELAKQKQIQQNAKDKIIDIRKMSFEDWQKKNEARTKELYDELAKQKQLQQDAKDEIAEIRQGGFEDWKEKNEARVKELEAALAERKKQQKGAEEEIANIRKESFEDWKEKNDDRVKKLKDALAKRKKQQEDAKKEIIKIRKESFEDWKKKNDARVKELEKKLKKRKKLQKSAEREIAKIRKESFEDWKRKNDARVKELENALIKRKKIQQDAKDEIKKIRDESFEEWKRQNEVRTKKFYDELKKQKSLWQRFCENMAELWEDLNTSLKSGFALVVEDWIGGMGDIADALEKLARVFNEQLNKAIADLISQKLSDWFTAMAQHIWEKVIPALLSFAIKLWEVVAATLILIATSLIEFIKDIAKVIFGKLIPALLSLIPKLWAVVAPILLVIAKFLLIAAAIWLIIEAIKVIINWIKIFIEWLKELEIYSDIIAMLIDLFRGINPATSSAADGIDNLNNSINRLTETIKKVPRYFDIVGRLHIPEFPRFATQYFDIVGKITSAQVGIPYVPRAMPVVVHREEAILNPAQAREWRGGGGEDGGQRTYSGNVEIKTLIPPDDPVFWRNLVREHIKQALDEEEARRTV